jgi:thioredoxin reductase (NADPH)
MHTAEKALAIIGSGPAGYTAAIYAARAGIDVVLYQGAKPGGQLTTTTQVENYPGYPDGVLGSQMMIDFQRQAERFGTVIKNATITLVDFAQYPFRLTVDAQEHVLAKSVIIATGADAQWLGIPAETRLHGRGVSACAVCDGFFFKGQDVVIVGGGDSAAEEALYLAHICRKVYMLVRSSRMRASYIMQQRVLNKSNIQLYFNTEVLDILGEQEVEGVAMVNNLTQEKSTLAVQGFFVAIGHRPNTALFASYLNLDPRGYISTIPDTTQTNIPGVFAAGDVQDSIYRQAITAAATGCMAALEVEKFLAR